MNNKKIIVKGKTNTKKSSVKTRSTNKKLDPKTLEIIAATAVLGGIISFFTLGWVVTLILVLGISAIVGFTYLLRKIELKGNKKKALNIAAIIVLVLGIIVALIGTGFLIYIAKTAPEFDPNLLNNQESSILYDNNGGEIIKLGAKLRENVSYNDLPQVLVDAIVATEDSRFFQHNGFDAPRFLKASLGQAIGNDAGGASTLSMQVVKNSYTDGSLTSGIKGIIRKFTDIYLAVFKLEKNYTKEQIIEFYVNNHLMGMNNWGVEQASQTYFGKSVSELNLAEASMIAGLFQSPNAYYPFKYPERAKKRQLTVLELMKRHGYISEDERATAAAISVESLLVENTKSSDAFQSYIDTVVEELEANYKVNPYVTPLLIYTNMDRNKQKGFDDVYNGVTYTWANDKVQGAAAAIENSSGKIVAVGAGRNRSGVNSYNFATMIKRQIGSTAKPIFDYAPGMEFMNWSTYQLFTDEPWSYTNGPRINNSDGKFMGQMTLRNALSLSRNIPALKAFQQNNKTNILNFATSLGLKPEVENGFIHEAHSLGAFNGSNPVQLAGAYAAFANGGYYIEPYAVSKIVYRENGNEVTHEAEKKQVMSDSTAFMITDILKDSVNTGLASGVKMKGVQLAAKTGTTNYDEAVIKKYGYPTNAVPDAWVAGYDPEYSLSIWYGYKNNGDGYNTNIQAVVARGRIYKALGNVLFSKNNIDFKVPDSVVKVGIEMGSEPALLASKNTPSHKIVQEYFKKGTEPTEESTAYQKLEKVTNLKVSYTSNKATISWDKVATQSGNESYGKFGYRVYLNGNMLGFTTNDNFEYDTSSPEGTYSVVTTFENYSNNKSDAVTYKFDNSKYSVSIIGSSSYTINIGDNIFDKLPRQYPFRVIRNSDGVDITTQVANTNYTTIVNNVDNSKQNITSKLIFKIDFDSGELKKDLVINVVVK